MINHLINWSLRNRFLVVSLTVLLGAIGIRDLFESPVDAIPDLSENQVIVYADWTGRSPQEIEDQITYPLSVNLQGLGGVKSVRGSSMFGFSLLTIVFDDQVEKAVARQRVLEKLDLLGEKLPAGVQARLGPDGTGLGWIYEYYLAVEPASATNATGHDLGELRALQDFSIRYQLNSVPGVAEVASIGGFVRQYQIEVDSQKMRAAGVTLDQIMQATGDANLNVGGKTIEENGMEFAVRGVGLVKSTADLEKIALTEKNGVPIFLREVARVELGGDYRRGALDVAGHEVVGGVVVMRTGENPRAVIAAVKAKIAALQPGLPPGVTIKSFYDRSELIDRTIGTLRRALIEEIILVTLVHIIFLSHFRSILIVTLPLPVSILVSFGLMKQFGITSNIMSMSGIAIAIGVLVDAAIVITENVIRHCALGERAKGGRLNPTETFSVVQTACRQVVRPIVFAMVIIILAFVPVLALTGPEGKLFHPLAYAKTFAMLGSLLLAVTVVPVLCTLLVRGPFQSEERNPVMNFLLRLYDPALDFALNHRKGVLSATGIILVLALALVPRMGSEFMPPLNEGSLLLMPSLAPGTSLTEVKRVMAWQDQVLATFPEVISAVGKLGRADTATDPAPVEMIETTIQLKPESAWRSGLTREKLIAEMTKALREVPGATPGFLQPIQGRVLMVSTGIRAQLGVKIFGDNLQPLQEAAFAVAKVVQTIPGATGVAPSRVEGKPYLEVQVNRDAIARFGLRVADVLEAVEAGIGGKTVSTAIEGRHRLPIQVRLQRGERDDLTRLGDVLITSPGGQTIPLGQLAEICRVEGPNEITSENGRLRAFVQANVSGRDLGGFVAEVKARLEKDVAPKLAAQGMTLEYGGEYENELHAARTLRFIVPCVLLIIVMLLFQLYGRGREAANILLAIPFALTGGIFLQYTLHCPFSVAVWVGYIALFGTAIQTAVVMVVYLEEAVRHRQAQLGEAFRPTDLLAAVKEGAKLRVRPKVMTVATIVASLLPIFWSHGAGAEVMKPLATPIIGGMVSSLVLVLLVTPVIFISLRSPAWKPKPEIQINYG